MISQVCIGLELKMDEAWQAYIKASDSAQILDNATNRHGRLEALKAWILASRKLVECLENEPPANT